MGPGMKKAAEVVHVRRKLIYFPILHTSSDMGGLSDAVKSVYLSKVGRTAWKRKEDMVNRFWDRIEESISGLDVEPQKIRIYQDGLPDELQGRAEEIVERLAADGSRNHKLILGLLKKGATLTGTESTELLMAEYNLTKRFLQPDSPTNKYERKQIIQKQDEILGQRDKYIAARINQTLCVGEVGIIFLGMLHNMRPWLARDIEVVFPIKVEQVEPLKR